MIDAHWLRRMFRAFVVLAALVCGDVAQAEDGLTATWHSDYTTAVEAAKEQGKYLLIYFHETKPNSAGDAFAGRTLSRTDVQQRLRAFECAKLPLDASILIRGRQTRLIDHPAFAEMQHRHGIAIVDFASPGRAHYGQVVNVFPFSHGRYYGPQAMRTILSLPAGTLTQRTMIYAVRMHPERPASTTGEFDPVLATEAESHSGHQATIRVQGHHGWGHRFQRILGRLRRSGSAPVEVVAESWPGKDLVAACEDCVDSWRQSSGHWQAVRSSHGAYGYDIKRGQNGIWYATGIFAGHRR